MSDQPQIIRLYFKGDSFENTMSLHELHKVLEGLKEMMQVIYGEEGYEVFVPEITPGSCDIKALLKEYGIQVSAGMTVVVLSAFVHTQGKEFSYEHHHESGSVTIINHFNEAVTFENGQYIPTILQSSKFRQAGQKITSPVAARGDNLTIQNMQIPDQNVVFDPESKMCFKEENHSIQAERIRGRIYEINIYSQSFKLDMVDQERKFTVKIASQHLKSIDDFLPYIGTTDLVLIGVAERNMEGEIVSFYVNDFEIEQFRMFDEEG